MFGLSGCAANVIPPQAKAPISYFFSHTEASHVSISEATDGREFSKQTKGTSFEDVFCIFEIPPHHVDEIISFLDSSNKIEPLPERDPYIDFYGVVSKSNDELMVLGTNWVKYWDNHYYRVSEDVVSSYVVKAETLVSLNNCDVVDVFE